MLKDIDGNLITDPDGILREIKTFYGNLYAFQDKTQGIIDENEINEALFDKLDIPKLCEDQKQLLETPLSKQEIYEVIKFMLC